jgi:DNA-binding NarL/FixJ family response regulator
LTPSQLVVLRLRATGLTNGQVAERLVVSEQTVKNHAAEAYKRLGTTDIVNAMNLLGWVKVS